MVGYEEQLWEKIGVYMSCMPCRLCRGCDVYVYAGRGNYLSLSPGGKGHSDHLKPYIINRWKYGMACLDYEKERYKNVDARLFLLCLLDLAWYRMSKIAM